MWFRPPCRHVQGVWYLADVFLACILPEYRCRDFGIAVINRLDSRQRWGMFQSHARQRRTIWKESPPEGNRDMMRRRLKSISRLFRVLSPVVEKLEERHLLSADPLAYQNLVQPLPYSLNFNSPQNGVFDTNGQGTGFTLVQPNRLGTQYQPSLVHLNTAASELDLTTPVSYTHLRAHETGR